MPLAASSSRQGASPEKETGARLAVCVSSDPLACPSQAQEPPVLENQLQPPATTAEVPVPASLLSLTLAELTSDVPDQPATPGSTGADSHTDSLRNGSSVRGAFGAPRKSNSIPQSEATSTRFPRYVRQRSFSGTDLVCYDSSAARIGRKFSTSAFVMRYMAQSGLSNEGLLNGLKHNRALERSLKGLTPALIPKSNTPHKFVGILAASRQCRSPSPDLLRERGSVDGDAVWQHRAARMARLQAKRNARTTAHVNAFIRINVVISSDRSFFVTIEQSKDIESLAVLIEAEYALRYSGSTFGRPIDIFEPRQRRLSAPASVVDDDEGETSTLEVCLLYDVGMVPLKFRDTVGDVLNKDDVVKVLSVCQVHSQDASFKAVADIQNRGQDHCGSKRTRPIYQRFDPYHDEKLLRSRSRASTASSAKELSERVSERQQKGKEYDRGAGLRQDFTQSRPRDLCFDVLHNRVGLEFFQEFCIRDFSLESLLFWLDAEMFASSPSSETLPIHARYIYLTYVADGAPLQVNLRKDVCQNVPWPLPSDLLVERSMFDEAQDYIYTLLKGHSFAMFTENDLYKQFMKVKNEDRARYEAGQMVGSFSDYFEPNLEVMQLAVDVAESSTKWVSRVFAKTSRGVKEQFLKRTMKRFFSNCRQLEGYFDDSNTLTTAQKSRAIQKEKKLAKFFGKKPSINVITGQLQGSASGRREHEVPISSDCSRLLTDISVVSPHPAEDSELLGKKKRMAKLEGFFGGKLGAEQLADQKLYTPYAPPPPAISGGPSSPHTLLGGAVSSILRRSSSGSAGSLNDERALPMNVNDFSADERRVLAKRSKKLRGILGQPLRESLVAAALTLPAKMAASYEDLWSPAIPEPEDRRRASHKPSEANAATVTQQVRKPAEAGILHGDFRRVVSSAASVMTLDDEMPAMVHDSKEYRRKKLEKLVDFLGEQVPHEALLGRPVSTASYELAQQKNAVESPPAESRSLQLLTQNASKVIAERSNKSERTHGRRIPPEILASAETSQLARESIASLNSILKDPVSLVDLVDCMADFDNAAAHGLPPRNAVHCGTARGQAGLNQEAGVFSGEDASTTAAKVARLRKLQRFFGEDFDPVAQMEANVFGDLEKVIDDEICTGKDLRDLKRQVAHLRRELRKKTAMLSFKSFFGEDELAVSNCPESALRVRNRFDPVAQMEADVLDDLEKAIDDEIRTGKDLQDLKSQVAYLRREFRRTAAMSPCKSFVNEAGGPDPVSVHQQLSGLPQFAKRDVTAGHRLDDGSSSS